MNDLLRDLMHRPASELGEQQVYNSCFVEMEDGYHLTTSEGLIVPDISWNKPPVIYSGVFVKKANTILALDGSSLSWGQGELFWFSHMWLCERAFDKFYVGRVKRCGSGFTVDAVVIVDELGACDYDSVIIKRGGLWKKLLYAEEVVESPGELDRSDEAVSRFRKNGATEALMQYLACSGGIKDEASRNAAHIALDEQYQRLLSECFTDKIAECIAPKLDMPLTFVQMVKDVVGTRTRLIDKI